jgi:hypothetical protein
MQAHYPHFKFIWKSPSEKGHAVSMNILLREFLKITVASEAKPTFKYYFMYLEDDWRLIERPVLHYQLVKAIDPIRSLLSNHLNDLNMNDLTHPFTVFLWASILLLHCSAGETHSNGSFAFVV